MGMKRHWKRWKYIYYSFSESIVIHLFQSISICLQLYNRDRTRTANNGSCVNYTCRWTAYSCYSWGEAVGPENFITSAGRPAAVPVVPSGRRDDGVRG